MCIQIKPKITANYHFLQFIMSFTVLSFTINCVNRNYVSALISSHHFIDLKSMNTFRTKSSRTRNFEWTTELFKLFHSNRFRTNPNSVERTLRRWIEHTNKLNWTTHIYIYIGQITGFVRSNDIKIQQLYIVRVFIHFVHQCPRPFKWMFLCLTHILTLITFICSFIKGFCLIGNYFAHYNYRHLNHTKPINGIVYVLQYAHK